MDGALHWTTVECPRRGGLPVEAGSAPEGGMNCKNCGHGLAKDRFGWWHGGPARKCPLCPCSNPQPASASPEARYG